MGDFEEAIEKLRHDLNRCVKAHSPRADSLYHNGGTVIALAATGTATILPTSLSLYAKIAAAVATFVIALSRSLDFGGRWRWHLEMRNAYTALLDRVAQLDVLPEPERAEAAKRVFDDVAALRARENTIPGASPPSGR